MDWERYFDNMAVTETDEYKKVGWGSKESMYSKFYTAMNLLPLYKTKRLLDIGCGIGAFEELLRVNYPSLEIHGIDISSKQLEFAQKRNPALKLQIGSLTDIPYPDKSFDCVTCFGVLQNFDGSMDKAFSEIERVLKYKGHAFIVTMDSEYVGFKSGERKQNPNRIYYSPNELAYTFEGTGFSIKGMGAISSKTLEGIVVPLHTQHTFFIWGQRQ